MAELKSNFGLHAFRKHGFMANSAWLLIVCLGHNLCCWTQYLGALGAGRDDGELRAKRLRYRYLPIPAMLVRSGRQLPLKLRTDHPNLRRFLAALHRLRAITPATPLTHPIPPTSGTGPDHTRLRCRLRPPQSAQRARTTPPRPPQPPITPSNAPSYSPKPHRWF